MYSGTKDCEEMNVTPFFRGYCLFTLTNGVFTLAETETDGIGFYYNVW